MPETSTSYTSLRENLSSVLDQVIDDQQVVIIKRKGGLRDVALISAAELSSMMETLYLMISPKNAARLMEAKARADARQGARRKHVRTLVSAGHASVPHSLF